MLEIPVDLPVELVPLSWLVGEWVGSGVLDCTIGDEHLQREFGQRVGFTHDDRPYLRYVAHSWLLEDPSIPLAEEFGYWRLARSRVDGDQGPGMLPATGEPAFTTAAQLDALREGTDGFGIEATIVHPDGVSELYLGRVAGPRIDLATDAVLRSAGARDYSAATRLYGLVEDHLLWAWDMAALGQDLRTHASARLARSAPDGDGS